MQHVIMEPPFNIVIIKKTLSVIEWTFLPNTRSVCVRAYAYEVSTFWMESFRVVVVALYIINIGSWLFNKTRCTYEYVRLFAPFSFSLIRCV